MPARRARVILVVLLVAVCSTVTLWRAWQYNAVGVDGLLKEIQQASALGDEKRMQQLVDKLIHDHPTHPVAMLHQGNRHLERGQVQDALDAFQRIADVPQHLGATARYLEGQTYLEQFQARIAEQQLLKSVKLNPQYLPPRQRLVELYAQQMRFDDLRKQLAKIRELRHWTTYEATLLLLAGRPVVDAQEGAHLMGQYIAQDDEDLESLLALARHQDKQDDADAALTTLEQASRFRTNDDRVAGLAGLILVQQDAWEQARLKRHLQSSLHDSSLDMWRLAQELSAYEKDWATAAAAAKYIASHDPFDPAAKYKLGIALSRIGQEQESTAAFAQADILDRLESMAYLMLRGAGRNPQTLMATADAIGGLLMQLDEFQAAESWYQQAVAFVPGNRELRRKLQAAALAAATRPTSVPHTTSSPLIAQPATQPPQRDAVIVTDAAENSSLSFDDVTAGSGIEYQYFNGADGRKLIVETIGGGAAVIDFDGDGWPDLFFPQGGPLPPHAPSSQYRDRLFRNLGNGKFADVTTSAGLGDTRFSQGCAVGDYDNDGDPDLFIANVGQNLFCENNGDGTFSTRLLGEAIVEASSSAAFGDLDNDGFLDLYVVNYVADWTRQCSNLAGENSTCDPQTLAAAQDRLLRNQGDGTFQDLTRAAGIEVDDGKGLGVIIADLNRDGWQDIYIANDGVPNRLFRNSSGVHGVSFVDVSFETGVAVNGQGRSEAGMGIACGDFNSDLQLDLFVTNFYRETNTLYLNDGSGGYRDATSQAGLATPSRHVLGFGTQAFDADLDGDMDLAIANGDIDDYSAVGRPWKMSPQLFQNVGKGDFLDVSENAGTYFLKTYVGRGLARLDFNQDGRPDLVVVHQDHRAVLLANTTLDVGQGLTIVLHGRKSNRDGAGALIECLAGNTRQLLPVGSAGGYGTANASTLQVGVGASSIVQELVIYWPSGHLDRWKDLTLGRTWHFIEGSMPVGR